MLKPLLDSKQTRTLVINCNLCFLCFTLEIVSINSLNAQLLSLILQFGM